MTPKNLFVILTIFAFLLNFESVAQTKSRQNNKIKKKESLKTEKVIETSIDPITSEILLSEPVDQKIETEEDVENKVWHAVELKPEYPGGNDAYAKYLADNYNVPKEYPENIKVFANFIVEKDGTLSDIKIIRSPGFGVDKEILRILEKSPRWNPGIQNGRPVRTLYTLPIVIKVQK